MTEYRLISIRAFKGVPNFIPFDNQPANFDSFAKWLPCIKRMLGLGLVLVEVLRVQWTAFC